MKEIWKDVPGYPLYIVSNNGNIYSKIRKRNLKTRANYKGYILVDLSKPKKRCFRVHSLVWMAFVSMSTDIPTIDHIDRDKANNNLFNLRECTNSQNSKNLGISTRKNKQSKYKGVSKCPGSCTWRASARLNGLNTHIGCFKNQIDAALAYDRVALKNYGEYACTNKMLGLL